MIYLNNSQYVEVRGVRISSLDSVSTNAIVEVTFYDTRDELVTSFTLPHTGNGTYIAMIPDNAPFEDGKFYKMITTISNEGLTGEWTQYMKAEIRTNHSDC